MADPRVNDHHAVGVARRPQTWGQLVFAILVADPRLNDHTGHCACCQDWWQRCECAGECCQACERCQLHCRCEKGEGYAESEREAPLYTGAQWDAVHAADAAQAATLLEEPATHAQEEEDKH